MAKGAAKLSISVPDELAKAVRRRVGVRGLSSFVARAMAHELEREQLGSYLAELERELGPVPKKVLALARAAWPQR
jgi:Arc/MetJ family transcription regulator